VATEGKGLLQVSLDYVEKVILNYYNQVFITSTFYELLLHAQILKAQKKTAKLSAFFLLLGSSLEKVACKTLMKLTLGVYDSNFFYTQLFR